MVAPLITGFDNILLVRVCGSVNVTIVSSIDRSVPFFFKPVPALILFVPENCENSIGETPMLIESIVTTNPE